MKPSKKCAVDALCLLMMTVFSSSSSVVSHPAGNNSDRQTFVRRAKADKLSSRSRESKANHDKETHPLNNTSQDQIGFQIIEGTIIPKQNEEPSNLHQNQMEFQLEDQEEANAAQNEEKTGQSYANQSGYQQIFGSMSTMEEEVTVQVDGSLTGLAGIGSLAELVVGRKDDNTMDVPVSIYASCQMFVNFKMTL